MIENAEQLSDVMEGTVGVIAVLTSDGIHTLVYLPEDGDEDAFGALAVPYEDEPLALRYLAPEDYPLTLLTPESGDSE